MLEEWVGRRVNEMLIRIKKYREELRSYRARRDMYGVQKYDEVR